MAEKTVCIKVTPKTKKRLDKFGKDSYENIIKGILDKLIIQEEKINELISELPK
jgi:hypothetical protein